ncbi:MAG: cbb3-type cytochrome c oxidase subunit 3 [Gammaproteobacteria bacterium]|nr:cbb3-type cytochrome c oxidase subunit 3 [Gammaproteobacteria bacterium]NND59668.1 cbb3-type cytochrome c oxidase subunit 3 [Gammaproteobacteria bacterium]
MGTVRGLITLALLTAFIALVVWLFVVRRRRDFDAAAQIPLQENSNAEDKRDE